MKAKTIGKLSVFLLVLITILSFSGCEWLFGVLIAPDGYVYNAKTGTALSDVTVKMTATDGTAYTATTNSSGYYYFEDGVKYGTYELTAEESGYVFTKQVIDITGVAQRLPHIGGFVPGEEVFSIVVFWDEGFADVDAYLSMPPDTNVGSAAVNPANFYETTTTVPNGFFPATGLGAVDYRLSVHNTNTTIISGEYTIATLDLDNFGGSTDIAGGPETISVYWFPFGNFTVAKNYTPTAAHRSGLPIGSSYAWVGTMEYYLDAWTAVNENKLDDAHGVDDFDALLAAATFGAVAANPVVYIFDSTGQRGSFTLPENMDIETASILRINLFYDSDDTEWYQFLPDIRAYASYDSTDRSLETGEPIVIKGKSRSN